MVTIEHKGSLKRTEKFLKEMSKRDFVATLRKYGEMGVKALADATPTDTGKTASRWSYELQKTGSGHVLYWKNSNVNEGSNIALLIQIGHGTSTGAYIKGTDYINPALKKVFDKMLEEIKEEVRSA